MSDPNAVAPAASVAGVPGAASAAIPFRQDPDAGFPVGGAVLLVVLMLAAAWAWWHGRTHGPGGGAARRAAPWASWLRRAAADEGELKVVDSVQPAPGVRLLVVEWSGGKVLVGINGTAAPAVLDRSPPAAGGDAT